MKTLDFEVVGRQYPTLSHDWTIWLTGLSGSGKSTLAQALAKHLEDYSLPYELLDGDIIRQGVCRDLGFSKEDRDENIRRIGCIAELLNRHNVIAIVAAISPYEKAREEVRKGIPKFLEVHVDCPLDTLVRRDVKGLYRRALAGQIEHFSGISDPYETPTHPDVYVNSANQAVEESLAVILRKLDDLSWLSATETTGRAAVAAR